MKMFKVCVATLIIGCTQAVSAASPAVPQVSFEQSMKQDPGFNSKWLKSKDDWLRLANSYQGYQKHAVIAHGSYLIPRHIHFISLDGKLSEQSKKAIATWKKFHPTWQVKVWTEADIASLPMINKVLFQAAKSVEAKTNILSYEILYRFGGLYVDTKIECIRAFDVIHQTTPFYAGIAAASNSALLSNSIIGCSSHHPIIQRCLQAIRHEGHKGKEEERGSDFFTKYFKEQSLLLSSEVVVFPVTFFYPPKNKVHQETFTLFTRL